MHQLPSRINLPIPRGKRPSAVGGHVSRFALAPTVRCVGEPRFRTLSVADAGCQLNVDLSVLAWICRPLALTHRGRTLLPAFEVAGNTAVELVAVSVDYEHVPDWAVARGMPIVAVSTSQLMGNRLKNARELVRYATWRASLSDRVRLLAALDQEGSLPLGEAMTAIRNGTDPIGAIAALALRRFVDLDLNSGRIGPETRVARRRD